MQKVHPLLIFPYNGNGIEALDCIGSGYQFIGFVGNTPHTVIHHDVVVGNWVRASAPMRPLQATPLLRRTATSVADQAP